MQKLSSALLLLGAISIATPSRALDLTPLQAGNFSPTAPGPTLGKLQTSTGTGCGGLCIERGFFLASAR